MSSGSRSRTSDVIRIALDAMGSDNAPRIEVEGAAQALRELPPTFRIQLAGRTKDVEPALRGGPGADRSRLDVVEPPEVGGMGEKPPAAVRAKPEPPAAMRLCVQ